jgi:hypothetical protein
VKLEGECKVEKSDLNLFCEPMIFINKSDLLVWILGWVRFLKFIGEVGKPA